MTGSSRPGTYIIEVTNPTAPVLRVYIPGISSANHSIWHEYQTYGKYLYIVSDDAAPNTFQIAEQNNIRAHAGVYTAVTGPTFETVAEYKYIRAIGGDAVGMSTVPEVIIAAHMKLPCFAVSVITDLGGMDELLPISHEDVLKAAAEAESKLTVIIKELLKSI